MLTWIGEWGRVAAALLPKVDLATADPESVCALLRELPQVQAQWDAIQQHFAAIVEQLCVYRYMASMELCVGTLRREGQLQLHVHMFIQAGSSSNHPPFRVEHASRLALFGAPPWASNTADSSVAEMSMPQPRRRCSNDSSAAAGHYYLAMPKVGKVFMHWANVEPWHCYSVRDVWISM